MALRTDLAVESTEREDCVKLQGVEKIASNINGITVTTIKITSDEAASRLQKPCGDYTTIDVGSLRIASDSMVEEAEALAEVLSKMLPNQGMVLVVGLGNSDITPDALGPKVINRTFATRHISGNMAESFGLDGLRQVAAISTGVLGQTGMESAELIAAVCKDISPCAVIAVDALACSDINRLGSTVQVTNTGISPGSGVQNKRKELSAATLGVPVIAIGLPTVVDMTTIAQDMFGVENIDDTVSERGREMMVTPREIDLIIERGTRLISLGINRALQPDLSADDIECLVS